MNTYVEARSLKWSMLNNLLKRVVRWLMMFGGKTWYKPQQGELSQGTLINLYDGVLEHLGCHKNSCVCEMVNGRTDDLNQGLWLVEEELRQLLFRMHSFVLLSAKFLILIHMGTLTLYFVFQIIHTLCL